MDGRSFSGWKQDLSKVRHHAVGFFVDLPPGEAPDRKAMPSQLKVARVVVLERDTAAVVAEVVGFDRDPIGAPDEVDLETADLDVHLGARKAMAPAEAQEVILEIAARAFGFRPVNPVSRQLRLPRRTADQRRRNDAAKIGDGPRHRRHGDQVPNRDQPFPPTIGIAPFERSKRRAAMKLPTPRPSRDAVPGHPGCHQLPIRDHSMLPLSDLRNHNVERVDLFTHGVNKSTRPRVRPPRRRARPSVPGSRSPSLRALEGLMGRVRAREPGPGI